MRHGPPYSGKPRLLLRHDNDGCSTAVTFRGKLQGMVIPGGLCLPMNADQPTEPVVILSKEQYSIQVRIESEIYGLDGVLGTVAQ